MRAAITLRSRDIVTVVPRRGDATAAGRGADGAVADAGVVATGAAAERGAAASTSSLRILPPIPVPRTDARFTPRSLASLRTIGVT
ncbi:unannotated protein [freshwater metagenome]|uniref:Unannotated protein n=1 Tax=freshwater metagenome TaxID=449393 RepID=A0A6J6H5K8_9ZZZZ